MGTCKAEMVPVFHLAHCATHLAVWAAEMAFGMTLLGPSTGVMLMSIERQHSKYQHNSFYNHYSGIKSLCPHVQSSLYARLSTGQFSIYLEGTISEFLGSYQIELLWLFFSLQHCNLNDRYILVSWQGGMYVFQLLDWYNAIVSLFFIAIFEVTSVAWFYGKSIKVKWKANLTRR